MMWLVGTFVVFSTVGYIVMCRNLLPKREKAVFFVLSSTGFELWLSILLHQPINVNQAIGFVIDWIF